MGLYCYRAFGLLVRSELELPELLAAEGEPDLEIRLGSVPARLPEPASAGPHFQASDGDLLFSVEQVARFHATAGRLVIVERINGASAIDLRAYLLGPVLAAILHQRGLLPLHASAIEAGSAAVLFIGPSRCGKSTLAAALARRGYRLLADDVAALLVGGETILVLPGFPQLKLWADAALRLGERPEKLPRVESQREKYGVAMREAFCAMPLPLRRAYALEPSAEAAGVSLAPVLGSAKVMLLLANTYRQQFLAPGGRVPNFEQCATVGASVELVQATRPAGAESVEALADAIEQDLARPA
jgi:hypothetical protein